MKSNKKLLTAIAVTPILSISACQTTTAQLKSSSSTPILEAYADIHT